MEKLKLKICSELKELPTIKISEINDLQGNLKDLFEKDYNKLSGLLKEYGFKYPLYLWFDKKGKAWNLDGNQRVRVINKIYGDIELPYISVFAENKKEAKKQILAISSEFGKVSKAGFDEFAFDLETDFVADFTTFDNWLDESFFVEPETEGDDEIPSEPKNIFVVRGDIFQIKANGVKIRIGCLDSCNSDDVAKLMEGQKADMSINDVPYGVEYQSNMRVKSEKFDVLQNDNDFIDFLPVESLFCKGFLFVWTSWKVLKEWIEIVENHNEITNLIVWNKGGGGMGDLSKTFLTDFEIAICCNRGNEIKEKRIGSVWSVTKDNANSYLHPTQKPVELIEIAIKHTTVTNQNILDLFSGSGTTAVACLKTKRNCFTNDISENYVQVSVKRCIDFCEKNNFDYEITLNGEKFDVEKLN